MITSAFLIILASLLTFLVGFLPVGTLPASVSASLVSVWGMVNAFSYLIALDTFITILVLVVAFDLIVFLWHLIQWVIRKVPGMS